LGEVLTYVPLTLVPGGYLNAYVGSRLKTRGVHRLVLLAFSGVPPAGERWYAHHRDGRPGHNCLDNLEWLDSAAHGVRHRRYVRYPASLPAAVGGELSDEIARAMMRRMRD